MSFFRNLWLPVALASSLGAWGATQPQPQPLPLPTPFPEARYRDMSARSPFAIATAPASSTAAPTPGFAANLYVDGVVQVGKSDFVAIKSRDPDKQNVLFVEVGQKSQDGIKVDSIHWSDVMGKTTVDVSKGGEKATLSFDEAQLAKNAAASAGSTSVRMPARPGVIRLPGMRPPAGPGFNRVFPAPGNPGMPNGIDLRRRIRGIQSGQ
ncbi:MAG TPA: hypothetical protein VHY22_04410 [Chthoniobacteraceae bacterium]|nr:hypothetical protein [Chthoniobacteraceae bacterium]